MTAKIHDEYAYPEDIDGYLKGSFELARHISQVKGRAALPMYPEYLGRDLQRACALSHIVFGTTEPETLLNTRDISLLLRMLEFADDWGWSSAALAMQKAAARASTPGKMHYLGTRE